MTNSITMITSVELRELHNTIKNDIIQDAFMDIPYQIPPIIPTVLDIGVDNHIEPLNIAKERFDKCYSKSIFKYNTYYMMLNTVY